MDKLLFTDEQKPLAQEIADIITSSEKTPGVISIGGKSGVGKTEIANLVRDLLLKDGILSKVLSQDNFYKPNHEQKRLDTNHESVGHDELIWTSIKNSLMNLEAHPMYDLIIFEGLYACWYEADINFYISQSYGDSYEFRKERGKENPDDKNRLLVLEKEADDIRRSKEFANHILRYGV